METDSFTRELIDKDKSFFEKEDQKALQDQQQKLAKEKEWDILQNKMTKERHEWREKLKLLEKHAKATEEGSLTYQDKFSENTVKKIIDHESVENNSKEVKDFISQLGHKKMHAQAKIFQMNNAIVESEKNIENLQKGIQEHEIRLQRVSIIIIKLI